ncbi:MAG: RidA family protein [Actinobacteria bacterium]|nr:RidA family protein [Actinomycetota bacterium]MCI0544512.1 RidA family protein [Actinomycetota bacterium]MCI0679534.1 RidA family protein [Actinomycetota bacterium]
MSRHSLFDPEGLPPATGFSYGALSTGGRLLHIAGMTGLASDGSLAETIVEQFTVASRGVARVITEAGGAPGDLVSLTIYTTDVDLYVASLEPIGVAYREVFGRHFPPMALIGVARLFDPRALVELVGVAVVPDQV